MKLEKLPCYLESEIFDACGLLPQRKALIPRMNRHSKYTDCVVVRHLDGEEGLFDVLQLGMCDKIVPLILQEV
jgi:hypothetical protein